VNRSWLAFWFFKVVSFDYVFRFSRSFLLARQPGYLGCYLPKQTVMIALILEIVIATFIAVAVWQSGHPILAAVAWFFVMGFSNMAMERK